MSLLSQLSLLEQFMKFNRITMRELGKVYKKAVFLGGNIVKRETLAQLRVGLPKAFHLNLNYSDKMSEGVRISIRGSRRDENRAKVHIMGNRRKGSMSYMLRFFENYPTERIGKNGHRYGHLPALRFFETAVTKTQSKAVNTIREVLSKTIERINEIRS